MAQNANRRGAAALILGYVGLPLPEEIMFVLLSINRRAHDRISVGTAVLKKAGVNNNFRCQGQGLILEGRRRGYQPKRKVYLLGGDSAGIP
jgi:hypothetical protein